MVEPEISEVHQVSAGPERGESPARKAGVLRRFHIPEALMVLGVVLIVAFAVLWARQGHEDAGLPAAVQPTPFPTAAPPTPTPTPPPTETPVPGAPATVALPTIPRSTPAVATPAPATSPPTRIVIPAINLDAPVVEVGWKVVERDGQTTTEWEVADYAAGFHIGSAYPGNVGNTVLSGHHNVRGKVFRYLVNVNPGDLVILYADGRAYYYRVESKQILPEKYASDEQRRKNAELIGYFPEERLTLVTCWPYTSNTHRVVVVARPVPPPADAK